jgi:hypothetical protein
MCQYIQIGIRSDDSKEHSKYNTTCVSACSLNIYQEQIFEEFAKKYETYFIQNTRYPNVFQPKERSY